jgi:hypothetical protein
MKENEVDKKVTTPEEEMLSIILTAVLIKSFEESMKIFETFIEEYNNKITVKKRLKN